MIMTLFYVPMRCRRLCSITAVFSKTSTPPKKHVSIPKFLQFFKQSLIKIICIVTNVVTLNTKISVSLDNDVEKMMLKQKESVSFTCKKEGSLGRIQIPIGQVSVSYFRESLWRGKREALSQIC